MSDAEEEPAPKPKKRAPRKKAAKKKAKPAAEDREPEEEASAPEPEVEPEPKPAAEPEPAAPVEEEGEEPIEVEASSYEASSEDGPVVDAGSKPPPPPPPEKGPNHIWIVLSHAGTLISFVLSPIAGVLAPLLIWLTLGREDESVERNAKEAFNFQVNMLLWSLVGSAMVLSCILSPVGILLILVSLVTNVVCTILATVKASNGEDYRYPWTYRFLTR